MKTILKAVIAFSGVTLLGAPAKEVVQGGPLWVIPAFALIWAIVVVPLIWLHNRLPETVLDKECPHCLRLVNRWRPHRCLDGQRRKPI